MLNDEEMQKLYRYLRSQYTGILNEQQIQRHVEAYVGLEIAEDQVNQILIKCTAGARVLDVGSGFGSFVLTARRRGFDAVGIDIGEFEVNFARKRLSKEMPGDDPNIVYRVGSGLELPFESESFDVVTLWNVLEHVPDYRRLISEAFRVLRRNGYLYIVCPNYASFRKEAHYFVYWPPLLPRKLASMYLKLLRKNPKFFESNIFYISNWSVLFTLKKVGMKIFDPVKEKVFDPCMINSPSKRELLLTLKRLRLIPIIQCLLKVMFYNPFKKSIVLFARKEE